MGDVDDEQLRGMVADLLAEVPPDQVDQVTFRGEQYDRGLAVVSFPEGLGGLGLEPRAQTVVDAELAKAPKTYSNISVNAIGIGMGMPTVLAYGSDEMKRTLFRPCFTGEEIWCQLFSEPSAGSDVAGLGARAVLDGDEWVVNGQKVWTTLAHVARWGMLVARSDPDQPKHKGLTYFLLDMAAPGVDVRPLFQITGEAEFNEVFLTDVRIPDASRLGDRGQGWSVAVTTLMNERVALGGGVSRRGTGPIGVLVDTWRQRRDSLTPQRRAVLRDRVVSLWARAEALRLTHHRAAETASSGTPGPEGSVGKLISAELNQEIYDCILDVVGADAAVHEPGYPMARPENLTGGSDLGTHGFLRSRANSIEGGTSEIMRNILGERVLGLPKEPGVDRDIPWSEIPRG
ncbi:MAG: acyl-CoA dehydrogenase family protein [Acidimicrobiales bacterium]